uniref:Uncharacterized protein n=1 Tax=Salix viminalis TaxID=40686 RepID=A0A6N2LLN0_SALVM
MALSINYFTYIQHLFIWGGILFWYIFLMAYGAMDPYLSTTAYKGFRGSLRASPVLLAHQHSSCCFPRSSRTLFTRPCNRMIHWLRNDGQTEDPEYCNMVRQRSLRPTTVGYTARLRSEIENV